MLSYESDSSVGHNERIAEVIALVSEIDAFPGRYPELPQLKRKIVALALGRVDWLRADGIDSLVRARDHIGIDWSRAVSAARWKK